MADIECYDIILKPVITEKSMNVMGDRKYTFMAHIDANKFMVKEVTEKMFPGIEAVSVNTMSCEGETKRRGMAFGKTAASKKAIIKLTGDSKEIEILQGLRENLTPAGHTRTKDLYGIRDIPDILIKVICREKKKKRSKTLWELRSIMLIHFPKDIWPVLISRKSQRVFRRNFW